MSVNNQLNISFPPADIPGLQDTFYNTPSSDYDFHFPEDNNK